MEATTGAGILTQTMCRYERLRHWDRFFHSLKCGQHSHVGHSEHSGSAAETDEGGEDREFGMDSVAAFPEEHESDQRSRSSTNYGSGYKPEPRKIDIIRQGQKSILRAPNPNRITVYPPIRYMRNKQLTGRNSGIDHLASVIQIRSMVLATCPRNVLVGVSRSLGSVDGTIHYSLLSRR